MPDTNTALIEPAVSAELLEPATTTLPEVLTPFDQLLATIPVEDAITGKPFERICKWILENDPVYQRQFRKVWLWDDFPERDSRDIGIDLVALGYDGTYAAVQAKHYGEGNYISKGDIDSFLSASASARYSCRILIGTTDAIGANARTTIAAQEKPVTLLLRSQLRQLDLPWSQALTKTKIVHKPKALRPHQRVAVKRTLTTLAAQDRATLVMACGTGKTITAINIAQQLPAEQILVLLPSLSLLGQTVREWCANSKLKFRSLAVCSDSTVVDDDDLNEKVTDLGFPVTTNDDEIQAFLAGDGVRVVFATYHSSPLVAKAARNAGYRFDLVIADEAHRCAGMVGGPFGTVLDEVLLPAEKRLFMTATPRVFTKHVLATGADAGVRVASMDDPEMFGPVAHELTFGEAVAKGLLSDYRVVILGVSTELYAEWVERGQLVTFDGAQISDAATIATQVATLQFMRDYGARRIVTFHSRVERAERFAQGLNELIDTPQMASRLGVEVEAMSISGKMNTAEREQRLNRLRYVPNGAATVVTNARCLSEGVDVPALDTVAFVDARHSEIEIVQIVGRALRNAPGKTAGTILIPVVCGEGKDVDTTLDQSQFATVWAVLRALRSHDAGLAEELDELRRELGRRGAVGPKGRGGCVVGRVLLDLPAFMDDAFIDAFNLRVVEEAGREWETGFGALEAFVDTHGSATEIPTEHIDPNGFGLGRWVSTQRSAQSNDNLSTERFLRLCAVPGWVWGTSELKWGVGFAALKLWMARGNPLPIPVDAVTPEGVKLGEWLAHHHGLYINGKLDTMQNYLLSKVLLGKVMLFPLPDREVREVAAKRARIWEEHYTLLRKYAKREQHTNVPRGHMERNRPLGEWVAAQRAAKRAGRLGAARRAKLEAIPGWAWTTRRTTSRSKS